LHARDERYLAALGRDNSISLYALDRSLEFVRKGPSVGPLARQIESADLNGDGFGDLLVLNGTGDFYLFLADGAGGFNEAVRLTAGNAPSQIELVDADGSGYADILVTNARSGDVSVLLNDGNAGFLRELRYRASDRGPYGIEELDNGTLAIYSLQETTGIAVADLNGDSLLDVVVINTGANSFSILFGKPGGALVDPKTFLPRWTSRPTAVDVGDFNRDGKLDLAILNDGSSTISIFLGDGAGEFTEQAPIEAGNSPTGFSVADVDQDGKLDLLVGNEFGDLLILPGRGDGTFEPFRRAEQTVTLAVADLNGDGVNDVVTANESRDRVQVLFGQTQGQFQQGFTDERGDRLLAPGAVQLVDLNNDQYLDLVLANRGGNNVLVYLGMGNGEFAAPVSQFAGTNPAGITVRDLNADGLLDLVVTNRGSNDVSILFGNEDATSGEWGFKLGPRLDVGEGPVSAELRDRNGDGIADLWVTNAQAGTISVLPGVGGGFFNDTAATIITLPGPTVPQGTVFDPANPDFGFVALRDGGIARFNVNDPNNVQLIAAPDFGARWVVPFDFGHNGTLELFVATNRGVSLLLDAAGNARFADLALIDPSLSSPSALALAELEGGQALRLYVTDEGDDALTVFDEVTLADFEAKAPGEAPTPAEETAPGESLAALARFLQRGGGLGAVLGNFLSVLIVALDAGEGDTTESSEGDQDLSRRSDANELQTQFYVSADHVLQDVDRWFRTARRGLAKNVKAMLAAAMPSIGSQITIEGAEKLVERGSKLAASLLAPVAPWLSVLDIGWQIYAGQDGRLTDASAESESATDGTQQATSDEAEPADQAERLERLIRLLSPVERMLDALRGAILPEDANSHSPSTGRASGKRVLHGASQ